VHDLTAVLALGKKPKLKSKADLARAVDAWASMASTRQRVDGEFDPKLKALREKKVQALTIDFDGKEIGFDEYEELLKDAIEAYVLEHRADIFEGDCKTAKFAAGTISLKAKAAALQELDGYTRKQILDEIVEEEGLKSKIVVWLKRLKLNRWLKLTPALDVSGITNAARSGELTADELAEYHFSFEAGETVDIKPADYTAATT